MGTKNSPTFAMVNVTDKVLVSGNGPARSKAYVKASDGVVHKKITHSQKKSELGDFRKNQVNVQLWH